MLIQESQAITESESSWRILSIVNFSRLLGGAVLLIIFKLTGSSTGWGSTHPELFYAACVALLVSSLVFGLAIRSRNLSQESIALIGSVLDSLIYSLLIHSSGSGGQGIGALLLMTICAAALILPRQLSIFTAAVAFIFLLGQQIYSDIEQIDHYSNYTSVGLFGLVLFISSTAIQIIGDRYRLTEQLALQRGVDIANLSQLNEYVVQRLREGVVVIDGQGNTRLMNRSAARMLNIEHPDKKLSLRDISEKLYQRWIQAVEKPYEHHNQSMTLDGLSRIVPSFIALGHRHEDGVLMFLEDISILQEKVQQSKLAALGRLSASIAHEIRNPLAAISHAEQLLSESQYLHDDDKYFTNMINRHVKRVNEIIENVLSLSRAQSGSPKKIDLKDWLANFIIEYLQVNTLESKQIIYSMPDEDVTIPFSPSQLHQIVENIFDNAIAHSGVAENDLRIIIHINRHTSGRWQMLMNDNGKGFSDDELSQIFEPFHSGNSQNSGLGLYISRELATLNRATLTACNNHEGSACFELVFADNERWKN